VLLVLLANYLHTHPTAVFQPGGAIAQKERNLILFALILSAIVVIPVFLLTIMIAWRYRDTNPKQRRYQPDWDSSRLYESVWWAIPILIIGILTVVTWRSTYALDPFKPLGAPDRNMTIQVVSMDWKWLFIYPDQHIASVNLAAIPAGQPVNFVVTSDSVMNSFWVPGLGGQMYTMPGMVSQLHEQANKPGDYLGSPANIAGRGFSRMDFTVRALPGHDFESWVKHVQSAGSNLTATSYKQLAKPSADHPVSYYSPVQDGLFNDIVMKYMGPVRQNSGSTNPDAMVHMEGM
jgi:cytochrome o ubiquinol oxidase subunit 2